MNICERAGGVEFLEAQRYLFLTKQDANLKNPLTSEQKIARQFILDCITNPNIDPKTLIIINGLPGIGKSVVINRFADGYIQTFGASVVDVNELINNSRLQRESFEPKHPMVIGTTPAELQAIKQKFPELTILQHTVKAMNHDETKALFAMYMGNRKMVLPEDKIDKLLQCSMGIHI